MDTADKQPEQLDNSNLANGTAKKAHCNGTESDADTVYYGVHIPSDIQVQDCDGFCNVFQDKLEALKVVKKYKKARFKAFNFYHEAAEFAVHGSEFPNNNVTSKSLLGTPVEGSKESQSSVGEKPPAFRGPKSQDLVKLRKGIEAGQIDVVQTTIWENPRYLISSGDTPSILQEGGRYNALHVAAKAKNRDMTELILNTVSNTSFVKLLYGDDTHQDADERTKMLLDLYLNTPDKALNETPLHFAVKFGAVDVVELLVSFPQCDKNARNKYGKTPNMIICDRCEGITSAAVKNKMAMLLEETYYVPVLRAEDNCTPPVIGEPFAPNSPPNFKTDILQSRMEIHAYAGPMNREGAEKFRRVWKTPPRSLMLDSPNNSCNSEPAALRFKDLDKGLERVGRALASKYEVDWKEYWPFLNNFADLSTPEGLQLLESYLVDRFNIECSCSSSPKYTSSSDSEAVNNAKEDVLSPISDLCKNFEACNLSDNTKKYSPKIVVNTANCPRSENHDVLSESQLFKPDLNPFLCVEKSCQVFAHRISNDILHLMENDYANANVRLETEVKQLQTLMMSFKEDARFSSIDFHLVHYRLGCLISAKLKEFLVLEDEYEFMRKTLERWLETCSKQFDCFSSDDESGNYRTAFVHKKSTSKNKQVMCLLECVLSSLTFESQIDVNVNTEAECVQVWGHAKPCICVWQIQLIRKGSCSKKTNSFKNRRMNRGDSEIVARQLTYDDEKVPNNTKNHCDTIITKSSNHQSVDNSPSDDEYFTPPTTPTPMDEDNDDEDVFEDSFGPESDVFIEGNVPTKTDYSVYNAVMCAERLNPTDFPHVYKWRHAVSLYPETERKSWVSPSIGRYIIGSPVASSTPPRNVTRFESPNSQLFSPPSSWLRITGIHSPKESLKRYRRSNSFNL